MNSKISTQESLRCLAFTLIHYGLFLGLWIVKFVIVIMPVYIGIDAFVLTSAYGIFGAVVMKLAYNAWLKHKEFRPRALAVDLGWTAILAPAVFTFFALGNGIALAQTGKPATHPVLFYGNIAVTTFLLLFVAQILIAPFALLTTKIMSDVEKKWFSGHK